MSDSEYTGDDLLRVFQQLNLNPGNLSLNVIRGWFDTDDEDMKDLLNWMCSSLNETNRLPAQEQLEYTQLERILEGNELEEEVNKVETNFPGIFQYESNLQEIELLQDEIETLKERQANCDMELKLNEEINRNLSSQFSKLQTDEIKSEIKKNEAQEKCEELSKNLDEANKNLNNVVIKYQQFLYNFEFSSSTPQFLSAANFREFDEKFKGVTNYLNGIFQDDCSLEVSSNNNFCDFLANVRNRILQSSWKCLMNELEVKKLKSATNFLDNYNTSVSANRDEKINENLLKDQIATLLELVEKLLGRRADNYTNQPRLRCAENELRACQLKLANLGKIEEAIIKVLLLYIEMSILYSQEKFDIEGSEKFFRNVVKYVHQDLQNCTFRKDAMEEAIKKYDEFTSTPVEKKFKLIEFLGSLLTDVKDPSLAQILKASDSINAEISKLESKLLVENPRKSAQTHKDLLNNIGVLEKFLVCGPTCRFVTVPRPLQLVFSQADSDLEKQNRSVKSATQTSSEALKKLARNSQLRHRRQLWMHFVNNPSKLASMFQTQQ